MECRTAILATLIVLLLMAGDPAKNYAGPGAAGEQKSTGRRILGARGPARLGPPTHVINKSTEYYETGPQQGRPADGKLDAGTRIAIVQPAGSYTLVRTQQGLLAYVVSDALEPLEKTSGMTPPYIEGVNRFALDLYAQLRNGDGNLFFSPSSISVALAMAYAGAAGTTQEEMAKTLHIQMPAGQLNDDVQGILAQWRSSYATAGYRLSIANRLWGQEGYEFRPKFLEVTRTKYNAELATLDFQHEAERARQTINRWVEQQTNDKIVDLVPAGALAADTKLVLTNAVYFKGDWTSKFDKAGTKEADFHVSTKQDLKVPLMHQQHEFGYAAADGLQVLEMPYGRGNLSMVVLLPEKVDGLAALEADLSHDRLQAWLSGLRPQEVEVYFPRFKVTASFGLNGALEELGMRSAFDPSRADFSGMSAGPGLFISQAIHKAFVDVNEEGTEAAAATGLIMRPTFMPIEKPKPVFRADHPFLFLIRDNRNGAILFLGRLTKPMA